MKELSFEQLSKQLFEITKKDNIFLHLSKKPLKYILNDDYEKK